MPLFLIHSQELPKIHCTKTIKTLLLTSIFVKIAAIDKDA